MEDYILRVISKEEGIRVLVCVTNKLSDEAGWRHKTTAAATLGLSETLTAASLLGALLKIRQRVAIKVEGDGPLKALWAESTSNGFVRGFPAHPEADYEGTTAEAIGLDGTLQVVKDVGLQEPARTLLKRTGRIADDITAYLNTSEQVPSHLEIAATLGDDGRIEVAGGVLLQSLPPYNEEIVQDFKNRLQELPPLEQLLLDGKTPEDIVALIFGETEHDVLENRPLIFKCPCDRIRTEQALVSLGRVQLAELIENDDEIVVNCHYCHEEYLFGKEEIKELLEDM